MSYDSGMNAAKFTANAKVGCIISGLTWRLDINYIFNTHKAGYH